MTPEQRMKHIGLLNLLAECAIFVDDDTRESIVIALEDNLPEGWTYKQILCRIDLYPPTI